MTSLAARICLEGGEGGQPIGSRAHKTRNPFVSSGSDIEVFGQRRQEKRVVAGGRRVIRTKRPSLLTWWLQMVLIDRESWERECVC